MIKIWKNNLSKYKDEALGLGIFMFSAGFFDALINYPGLPIRNHISSALLRRFMVGLTMGGTALYIFTSDFGKQSGAYINPAITIVRYFLKDITRTDGIFYILFQFIGGSLGMCLVVLFFPNWMKNPEVNYIVTAPGTAGVGIAFIMEFMISGFLMWMVLLLENSQKYKRNTALVVSILITLFITFEAPFSGMSMNPARTFASAIVSGQWKTYWLYCLAPLSGMSASAFIYGVTKTKTHIKK